jgi:hypothetical protein
MQRYIPSECVRDYDECLIRVPFLQNLNQVNQLKLTFIYEQTNNSLEHGFIFVSVVTLTHWSMCLYLCK